MGQAPQRPWPPACFSFYFSHLPYIHAQPLCTGLSTACG